MGSSLTDLSMSPSQGIKKGDGTSSKDFKTTKSRDQILSSFRDFTEEFPHAIVSESTSHE